MKRALLAAVVAGVALVGCSSGTARQAASANGGPDNKTTLGLTYIPNVQFAPAYLAADEKLFGNADVTLRHHGAQEGLFTALTSGQEDFVIAGGDELLQARSQGMDVVAVASYYKKFPVEVITRPDTAITDLRGLKGKTVGVPGRFGTSWFAFLVALQSAGLTQSDVAVTEVGYTGQAALSTKKVDAIIGFSNNDAVQLTTAGTQIVQIPVAHDVPLVSTVLITTGKMIKEKPAVVTAVAHGVVAGERRATEAPDAAMAATKQRVPDLAQPEQEKSARATLAATVPLFADASGQVTGTLDAATWDKMAQFMVTNGVLTKPIPADEATAAGYAG